MACTEQLPTVIENKSLKNLASDELYSLSAYHFCHQLGDYTQTFEQKFYECLRYLYLLSKYHKKLKQKFMPLKQEVDDMWHFFIIQTREYERLCSSLPGKVFLHHKSLLYEKYQEKFTQREQSITEMLMWIPLYVKNFGCYNENTGKYWKIVAYLHEKKGMAYEEISRLS